jgi:hypothetical protein
VTLIQTLPCLPGRWQARQCLSKSHLSAWVLRCHLEAVGGFARVSAGYAVTCAEWPTEQDSQLYSHIPLLYTFTPHSPPGPPPLISSSPYTTSHSRAPPPSHTSARPSPTSPLHPPPPPLSLPPNTPRPPPPPPAQTNFATSIAPNSKRASAASRPQG